MVDYHFGPCDLCRKKKFKKIYKHGDVWLCEERMNPRKGFCSSCYDFKEKTVYPGAVVASPGRRPFRHWYCKKHVPGK